MNSKEAIAVLHNNQYQKHLGNGEYDYIHPLTDAEAKAIEELIQQQDKMLDIFLTKKAEEDHCPSVITALDCDNMTDVRGSFVENCKNCWRKYLQSEVGK